MWLRISTCLLVGSSLVVGLAGPLARDASAQQGAVCPAGVTLRVSPPTNEAPTTVNTSVSPAINLKPVTAGDASSFHLHYFIDTTPTAGGDVIASNEAKVLHSGAMTQDLGPLTPGMHTVTVVLGRFDHTACDARATATFLVGQAEGVLVAPKSGGAGLAAQPAAAGLATVLIVLTVATVAAARLWTARGSGPR